MITFLETNLGISSDLFSASNTLILVGIIYSIFISIYFGDTKRKKINLAFLLSIIWIILNLPFVSIQLYFVSYDPYIFLFINILIGTEFAMLAIEKFHPNVFGERMVWFRNSLIFIFVPFLVSLFVISRYYDFSWQTSASWPSPTSVSYINTILTSLVWQLVLFVYLYKKLKIAPTHPA